MIGGGKPQAGFLVQDTMEQQEIFTEDELFLLWKEAYDAIDEARAEIKAHNDRLLKVLKKMKGADWIKGLDDLCNDCEVSDKMFISRRKPRKEYWQKENFGPIKEMWVRQRAVGDSGDSWEGEIWVQIDSRRYLELHYVM